MAKKLVRIHYRAGYEATLIVDEDVEVNDDLASEVDPPESPTSKYIEQTMDVLSVHEATKDDMDALSEHWGLFIKNQKCDGPVDLCSYYKDLAGIELTIPEASDFYALGEQWLEAHDG